MKRYLKVYLLLLKLNWYALLAYRANFINSFIATMGWGGVSFLTMYLVTFRTSNVFGWTGQELLIATALYSIIIGLFHAFFSRNFERFSRIIHYGELDTILIKPLDDQFLISFWVFRYTNLARIAFGIGFLIFMLSLMHVTVTIPQLLLFLVLLPCSIMLLYSVWFATSVLTIWFTNLSNLIDFNYNISNLGRYPTEMITSTKNIILFIFVPLTFVATFPAKVLLHKITFFEVALLVVLSLSFFYLSRKFWKFALRFYTSASG